MTLDNQKQILKELRREKVHYLQSQIKNKILICLSYNEKTYYSIVDGIIGDFNTDQFYYIRSHHCIMAKKNDWSDQFYFSCPFNLKNLSQFIESSYYVFLHNNESYYYYLL